MDKKNSIYLIGPMGAGKTSVGTQLAKKLHKTFYDTDQVIQNRSGVTISWIFDVEQEAGFRRREAEIIDELTQLDDIVLSTGGGCVITDSNRVNLKANGTVVYLKVSLPVQLERTSRFTAHRPLAAGPNREQRMAQLQEQRQHFYEEIADLTYDTDQHEPHDIARMIIQDIKANV